MNFIKEKIKDFYLLDCKIENIFINEYMTTAPGDYVKVFIFAQMYAEFGLEMTDQVMARQLGLSEKKISEAWNYWEDKGAVKRHYLHPSDDMNYTVEFLNLKELMYGKSVTAAVGEEQETQKSKNVFGSDLIKDMFSEIEKMMARTLSSAEITNILSWVTDEGVPPEIIMLGFTYCLEKNKTSIKYIEKVIHEWVREGLTTVDQVSEKLQEVDEKYYRYKRVLRALGFTRNATEKEIQLMDCWFDELGYNMDRVLEACTKTAGISSPNFNYVNKVLENWRNEAENRGDDVNKKVTVTQTVLNQYYDYLRNKASNEAESRKAEVYETLPRIREIDDEIQQLSTKLSKALILGGSGRSDRSLQERLDTLAGERAVILTENNYEMDYTDIKYACDKCNDTGITDLGERCSCINQRIEEAEIWQKRKVN